MILHSDSPAALLAECRAVKTPVETSAALRSVCATIKLGTVPCTTCEKPSTGLLVKQSEDLEQIEAISPKCEACLGVARKRLS